MNIKIVIFQNTIFVIRWLNIEPTCNQYMEKRYSIYKSCGKFLETRIVLFFLLYFNFYRFFWMFVPKALPEINVNIAVYKCK